MAKFVLTLPINPLPKGRPRLSGGHVHTPKVTKQYEKAIGTAASVEMSWLELEPFTGDVSVKLTFVRNTRKACDLDNLIKSVLDGCNGVVFNDDNQVKELYATMGYDKRRPSVTIEVMEVSE